MVEITNAVLFEKITNLQKSCDKEFKKIDTHFIKLNNRVQKQEIEIQKNSQTRKFGFWLVTLLTGILGYSLRVIISS